MSTSELIGSKEACRILDRDRATLTRWVKSGRLTAAAKLPSKNGAFFFNRTDVLALRDELTAAAPDQATA